MSDTSVVKTMVEQWNKRGAQDDYFRFIASEKRDWREEDFLASGERDVAEHLDPFLRDMGFDPKGKTMVEIGCGAGRMTFALAKRFGEVQGVDISSEMVQRAEGLKAKLRADNVRFSVGTGSDLQPLPDRSFDFCFSFIVLQHIPDASIILNYVSEIGRTLKADGLYRFQVNGFPHLRLPGATYLMAGVRLTDRLRRVGIHRRPFVFFGKLNTIDGAPMRVGDLKKTCAASGLSSDRIDNAGCQYMWVGGRKIHTPEQSGPMR